MWKHILVVMAVVLISRPLSADQKPKIEPPQKSVLTEEEKDILRNRELLENMNLLQNFDKFQSGNEQKDILGNREIIENIDLLQDFEKFRFYDLFAGETEPESKTAKEPAAQQDGKKKQ
jgi:hypothetical protein